jgi:hypothetical protein
VSIGKFLFFICIQLSAKAGGLWIPPLVPSLLRRGWGGIVWKKINGYFFSPSNAKREIIGIKDTNVTPTKELRVP